MAAAWDGVGRAGDLVQLLGVDAFGLVSMITQAALTARRNRDACLQLAEHVRVVEGLLRRLHLVLPRLRRRPETRRPLEQLDDALRRAYLLVRSCGQELELGGYIRHLLTAAHTAAKLRAAEEVIDRYILLVPVILAATVPVRAPTSGQDTEEVHDEYGEDSASAPAPAQRDEDDAACSLINGDSMIDRTRDAQLHEGQLHDTSTPNKSTDNFMELKIQGGEEVPSSHISPLEGCSTAGSRKNIRDNTMKWRFTC